MIKVRILDRCEFCDGEAYVFICEDVDARGDGSLLGERLGDL